nr:glycerate kinase [uncultured Merdimonas sp.]
MKIVAAIDSFKGSMTSIEAGNAAKVGILAAHPQARVVVKPLAATGVVLKPLADGGEGTTDALIEGLDGEKITLSATGPFGDPVSCYYGFLAATSTAVIEMASAAGITLSDRHDPLAATTRGVGEMILDALNRGCRDFIIGIGGSATNDGGVGMLSALGVRFLDRDGKDAGEGGQALGKITSIDLSGLDPRLKGCRFQVACDVTNPLCGKNGATYIYGPQKGVTDDMKEPLDQAMTQYASVCASTLGIDYSSTPGSGAAGGLGFAFQSFLNGVLTPGIDLILKAVGLEEELKDADIVITGEGRLDHQTAMGKAPVGVASLARKYGAKVIAFAGSVTEDASACNDAGIDAFFPIVRGVCTLEEAMEPSNAKANLSACAEQVFRLL